MEWWDRWLCLERRWWDMIIVTVLSDLVFEDIHVLLYKSCLVHPPNNETHGHEPVDHLEGLNGLVSVIIMNYTYYIIVIITSDEYLCLHFRVVSSFFCLSLGRTTLLEYMLHIYSGVDIGWYMRTSLLYWFESLKSCLLKIWDYKEDECVWTLFSLSTFL